MARMTDEEANALDELLTRTTPKLGPNGTGFFSSKGYQMIALDEETARILNAQAIATRRSPAEIIAELVHKRLTVNM
ncbi:MAG: ribbon-helix-helix domain-containing protein [Leptospirales bacterium]|nr:ribbon-helix-helix domain-containing protein [Leptospirales bacterium]